MRIHDLEAAQWREAAGGYHKKSIASDVALLDVGAAAELQLEGDGEHLVVVLNGSGKVAAGSRGAFLSGGICLGLESAERVALRPDSEKGLLLLYVRLPESAAESLFASIPERNDGWEIATQPVAAVAETAPAEPEAERDDDDWEEDDDGDDDDDDGERAVADAESSEQVVTDEEERAPARPSGDVAVREAVWVDEAEPADRAADEDDEDDEDDDDDEDDAAGDDDDDGAGNDDDERAEDEAMVGEPVTMTRPQETETLAEDEQPLAAAATARGAEETTWYSSNRSNGAFGLLPRGLVHRTESGELVINGRPLSAGKALSIYHRRRWVQTRARYDNGRWYVVVDSQHVPLVPGMRARLDF